MQFLVPLSSYGVQPKPAPLDLLQRARSRLLSDMNRQVRYTCTQNIVRRFFRSDSKEPANCTHVVAGGADGKHDVSLTSWDHVALDVAIADNREIHAWHGAPKFAEEEIRELIGNGAFGSGDLAAFIVGVFGSATTVDFQKLRRVNGHDFLEYKFEVPESVSNYKIAHWGRAIAIGYRGTFLLDQSADLVELVVRTAELPIETQACQAVSKIEYQRINIHGGEALMPRETNLSAIFRDGEEALA